MVGESQEAVGAGAGAGAGGGAAGSNKLPTLSEYGTNLTNQALEVSCAILSLKWDNFSGRIWYGPILDKFSCE